MTEHYQFYDEFHKQFQNLINQLGAIPNPNLGYLLFCEVQEDFEEKGQPYPEWDETQLVKTSLVSGEFTLNGEPI